MVSGRNIQERPDFGLFCGGLCSYQGIFCIIILNLIRKRAKIHKFSRGRKKKPADGPLRGNSFFVGIFFIFFCNLTARMNYTLGQEKKSVDKKNPWHFA
jgi:hypothetical protein